MAWVLILTPTDALRMVIKGAVRDVLGEAGIEAMQAKNVAEADGLIRKHGLATCRLIVCSASVPQDASEVPAIDGRQLNGIGFVRTLRASDPVEPPVIFIGALADTERKAELSSVANSTLVVFDDRMWDQLPLAIRTMAKLEGANADGCKQEKHVDLDIVLRASGSSWTIKSGDGAEDGGNIGLQPYDISRLVSKSVVARHTNGEYLHVLGEDLFNELMGDQIKNNFLATSLEHYATKAGGMQRARIRFSVDEKTHPILLETLAFPGAEGRRPRLFMLHSPLFRKLGTKGQGASLLRDTPVNCLLIQGQVDSFERTDGLGSFDGIPQAESEIAALQGLLTKLKASGSVGEVDVLRRREHPRDFPAVIRKALEGGKYQLVHYAGHSKLGTQKQPWLVLGRAKNECLHAADFAKWAGGLQFMFLSSCESADAGFILQMVQHTPAVVGYAWPADDELAAEFARTFYEHLFGDGEERHMLEYSFMAAKQALHYRTPETTDWAAPLLFMQVMETGKRATA